MKDDTVFLRHMLEEVDFILRETSDVAYENLVKDEVLKRALLRSLEIIGEATKNLSQGFREEHSEVTWKELAGLRDKLIHHYFGVDWRRVWDVIRNIVPELGNALPRILDEAKGPGRISSDPAC